jgi:hypothetical protein
MLMRFEPFREIDRMTEELRSQRRARPIPVDAYRRGNIVFSLTIAEYRSTSSSSRLVAGLLLIHRWSPERDSNP